MSSDSPLSRESRHTLRDRWRAWRRERAELRLADAEHELALWGRHHGIAPSERRRLKKKVEHARRKLEAR